MPTPWIDPSLSLIGRHVRLEPLSLDHIPALHRAARDPELWRFVPVPSGSPSPADSLEGMEAYVRAALAAREAGEAHPFVIRTTDGTVAGSTRYYALSPAHRNLEIGYTWLEPSWWRTPVNSECKLLLLRHAFDVLHCLRVALRTDARNVRSRRAIERLGAVQEGILRKHMVLADGHVRDTVYYSLTDAEWPAARQFLESALADATGRV